MLGSIARVGTCLALVVATCGFCACYKAPEPDCGFICGPSGACPEDYTCASDNVCHRNGAPAGMVCTRDGGIDARPIDAARDADTTAPTVTAMTPSNNATNVALNTMVTATFSESVTGVSASSFTLDHGGTAVPGTVTYTDATHTAAFTPTTSLPNGTVFTATLTGSITDGSANALAPVTWHFTTIDTTPPTVTSRVPAGNDTNVATSTTIVVVFSEPVTNVNTTSFAVDDSGTPIAGTIASSGGGTTYTFTPTAALPAATAITVTLSSAITDTAGNPLATVTYTFTTA
ncbi:MAG: hypothetical protein JWO36_6673 [Myxococcales bacterium]|nr:hypothetical protein [Myxococcales bacterium]